MTPQEVPMKAPSVPVPVPPQLGEPPRPPVAAARRLVVKLGTRVLTAPGGELERARIAAFAATVAGLLRAGREVVLVSSGAVGHGRRALGLERAPLRPSLRQACAAVGQSRLMDAYQRAFRPFGLSCGQLLIGQHDFDVRRRTLNLRETLSTLLHEGVVPVVNENDALAFLADAVRPVFGDNDRLAALTASETAADLLVLLTDVEGVYDRDPRRHRDAGLLSRVDDARQLPECPAAAGSDAGRGGMKSKLDAARMAVRGGCHVVIAGGRDPAALSRVAAGDDVGTWFPARERLGSRQRWIAFASVPRGVLHLDDGAVAALRHRGASLLPAGVRRVEGSFRAGDVVELRAPDGELLGRALARLGAVTTRRYCKTRRDDRTTALIRRANIVLEDAG